MQRLLRCGRIATVETDIVLSRNSSRNNAGCRYCSRDHNIVDAFVLLDSTTTMNEITTSYSVTFRMITSPPELDVTLKLIRRAKVFAESLVATALKSLHEYEYIAGPIQVQGVESSLTRKFENHVFAPLDTPARD
jgi:hypothetical protein